MAQYWQAWQLWPIRTIVRRASSISVQMQDLSLCFNLKWGYCENINPSAQWWQVSGTSFRLWTMKKDLYVRMYVCMRSALGVVHEIIGIERSLSSFNETASMINALFPCFGVNMRWGQEASVKVVFQGNSARDSPPCADQRMQISCMKLIGLDRLSQ